MHPLTCKVARLRGNMNECIDLVASEAPGASGSTDPAQNLKNKRQEALERDCEHIFK